MPANSRWDLIQRLKGEETMFNGSQFIFLINVTCDHVEQIKKLWQSNLKERSVYNY